MSDMTEKTEMPDRDGVPPPYTLNTDNLPQYHDLPPKKVDLPPYQNGEAKDSSSECHEDSPWTFQFMSSSAMSANIETLGTDSVFILSFLACFLFNWIGYVICCCLFTTVAARCGAISGIGLNLVKMMLILKNCEFDNSQMVQAQDYLALHEIQYILLMSLGMLTMLFGIVRYNSAKSAVNRQLLLPRYTM